jgi:hypothetical protein
MSELFVFGAGASYASGGTPLGKDLVWSYYEECFSWYEMESGGGPTAADQEERQKEFADFRNFLEKMQGRYPALSGIVQKLDDAIGTGQYLDLKTEKPYYIDEIMEDLVHDANYTDEIHLIRRIAAQHITQTSGVRTNNYYKEFVKSLRNKTSEDVSIISFNFDCLLRDDLNDRVYFDYLIEFKEIDDRRCFYKPGQGIPLLKLHGSLDWRLDVPTGDVTLLPAEWNENYGGEPYVFLPHEQANKKIDQLWKRAAEFVRNAEKIIFIGYSLPSYDRDAIGLFQSNVKEGTQIEVIDSSKATIDRFKGLFSDFAIKNTIRNLGDSDPFHSR